VETASSHSHAIAITGEDCIKLEIHGKNALSAIWI